MEHVDTHANPADEGSRQGTSCKLAKRLGRNPTGVGKVSICAGLHGGRWSHRVVKVFQDLCSFSGLPFLRCRRVMFRWAGIVLASVSAVGASEIWVVSVGKTSFAEQVAVRTCSGLFNRDESVAGASFVLGLRSQDEQWLADLEGNSTKTTPVRASRVAWPRATSGTHRGTGTRDRRCLRSSHWRVCWTLWSWMTRCFPQRELPCCATSRRNGRTGASCRRRSTCSRITRRRQRACRNRSWVGHVRRKSDHRREDHPWRHHIYL